MPSTDLRPWWGRVKTVLAGSVLVSALASVPVHAVTWTLQESDGFETTNCSEDWSAWDDENALDATNTIESTNPHSGSCHLKTRLNSDSDGGVDYGRVQWTISRGAGTLFATDFWVYVPQATYDNIDCTWQPWGVDAYPADTKQLRMMRFQHDGDMYIVFVDGLFTDILAGPFAAPAANTWTKYRVEVKVHNTDGWVKVYNTGATPIAEGDNLDTYHGTAYTRSRWGVADCSGQDSAAINFYTDDVTWRHGTE